jgi:hypothetical protein
VTGSTREHAARQTDKAFSIVARRRCAGEIGARSVGGADSRRPEHPHPERRDAHAMTNSEDKSVGLCSRCRHARQLVTPRSRFWFCERSKEDKSFERYPRLPMLACRGFEAGESREAVRADPPAEPDS